MSIHSRVIPLRGMRIDVFFLESAVVYHLPLSKAAESARGRASSRRRPYRRGLATSIRARGDLDQVLPTWVNQNRMDCRSAAIRCERVARVQNNHCFNSRRAGRAWSHAVGSHGQCHRGGQRVLSGETARLTLGGGPRSRAWALTGSVGSPRPVSLSTALHHLPKKSKWV
jgi:hypothetical protein